ncbi:MAG: hypothetical protein MK078_16865 [Crocinitomicaceae bacterium]|nr:hypothetical protein [Crocinitomicaceae bacterium]
MIKKLLYLTVLLTINLLSYGQRLDARAHIGFSILELATEQSEAIINGVSYETSLRGRPGLQSGLALTIGERFYVQPGIQWTSWSQKIIHTNMVTNEDNIDQVKMSTVSVPIKVGTRLLSKESTNLINIRVFGGLDGHHIQTVNHRTKSGLIGDLTVDDYSQLIVNADLGMGADFLFMFADIGYQIGLTSTTHGVDKAKVNAFYTNFGFRLKF